MGKSFASLDITDDAARAVADSVEKGTGILVIKEDGSVAHVPYEEVCKLAWASRPKVERAMNQFIRDLETTPIRNPENT